MIRPCAVLVSALLASAIGAAQNRQNLVDLLESGHCNALPQLRSFLPHIQDKEMKRRAGVAGVRCAMPVNAGEAVYYLEWLAREFPHDPAVLYLSTRVYSDLSVRASQELLYRAPGSPQVHQLNAEALESQGKWKEAADEYRTVLRMDARLAGIHFRLGRLMLSQPGLQANRDDARHEFEEELKIDSRNAGAEFVLGELARQDERWPEAVAHFSRATRLDASFFDAYLGLGRAYLGAGQDAKAVGPLEAAAKLNPENTIVHFQLATAYRRTGRKAEADRESALHEQINGKMREASDRVANAVSGAPAAPKP